MSNGGLADRRFLKLPQGGAFQVSASGLSREDTPAEELQSFHIAVSQQGPTIISGLDFSKLVDAPALAIIAPQPRHVASGVGSVLADEIMPRSGSPIMPRSGSPTLQRSLSPGVRSSSLDSESKLEAAGLLLEELSSLKVQLRKARSTLLSGHNENSSRQMRWAVSPLGSAGAHSRLGTSHSSPRPTYSFLSAHDIVLQTPGSPLQTPGSPHEDGEQRLKHQLQMTNKRLLELEDEVESGSRALDVANVKLAEQLLLSSTLSAKLLWPEDSAGDALADYTSAIEEDTACTVDPFVTTDDGIVLLNDMPESQRDDPIESLSPSESEGNEEPRMPFSVSSQRGVQASFRAIEPPMEKQTYSNPLESNALQHESELRRLFEQEQMSQYVANIALSLNTSGLEAPMRGESPAGTSRDHRGASMTSRARVEAIERILNARDAARALLCWVHFASSARAERIKHRQELARSARNEEDRESKLPSLDDDRPRDEQDSMTTRIYSRVTEYIDRHRRKQTKISIFQSWRKLAVESSWQYSTLQARVEESLLDLTFKVIHEWSSTCRWRVSSRRAHAKIETKAEHNFCRNVFSHWWAHACLAAHKVHTIKSMKKRVAIHRSNANFIAWAAVTSCQQLSVQECDWDCGFTGTPNEVAAHEMRCEAMLLATAWKSETALSFRPQVTNEKLLEESDRERLMLWLPVDSRITACNNQLGSLCASSILRGWLPGDSPSLSVLDEHSRSDSEESAISNDSLLSANPMAPSFGSSKRRNLIASICKLVRSEDEDLGDRLASSIAKHSAEDAADQIAAALVKTTAEAMSRCLIGEAEATVKNFLQVLEEFSTEKLPVLVSIQSQEQLCGVGLRLAETYPPRAIEILPRGPAGMCGLIEIGDMLTKIDGHDVTKKNMALVRSMIIGPERTLVSLEFGRLSHGGTTDVFSVTLTRAVLDFNMDEVLKEANRSEKVPCTPRTKKGISRSITPNVELVVRECIDGMLQSVGNSFESPHTLEAVLDESLNRLLSRFDCEIDAEFRSLETRGTNIQQAENLWTSLQIEPSSEDSCMVKWACESPPVHGTVYANAKPQLPSVVTWSIGPLSKSALESWDWGAFPADKTAVPSNPVPEVPDIVLDETEIQDIFHAIEVGSFIPLASPRSTWPRPRNIITCRDAAAEQFASDSDEKLKEERTKFKNELERQAQDHAGELVVLMKRCTDAESQLEQSRNIIRLLEEEINLRQFQTGRIESEFCSLQNQPCPSQCNSDDMLEQNIEDKQSVCFSTVEEDASDLFETRKFWSAKGQFNSSAEGSQVPCSRDTSGELESRISSIVKIMASSALAAKSVIQSQLKKFDDELKRLHSDKQVVMLEVHSLLLERDMEIEKRNELEAKLITAEGELADFRMSRTTNPSGLYPPVTPDSNQARRSIPPGWKQYWSKSKDKPFYKRKGSSTTFWQIPEEGWEECSSSHSNAKDQSIEGRNSCATEEGVDVFTPLAEDSTRPASATQHPCGWKCGFAGTFTEVAVHEEVCHLKGATFGENHVKLKWGCEFDCGFKGTFDEVSKHEVSCQEKSQRASSNSQKEPSNKEQQLSEQVHMLTDKLKNTEQDHRYLGEQLQDKKRELDDLNELLKACDLDAMTEIAKHNAMLIEELKAAQEQLFVLNDAMDEQKPQAVAFAAQLQDAALHTERLGLEVRAAAEELLALKNTHFSFPIFSTSGNGMPIAVGLTLESDFNAIVLDPLAREEFNESLTNNLSIILGVPKSSLQVLCHQRGSVIADVVIMANQDLVGTSLAEYDDRTPEQVAQKLVDMVHERDNKLLLLPMTQLIRCAEIRGPIAKSVCGAVIQALCDAHENKHAFAEQSSIEPLGLRSLVNGAINQKVEARPEETQTMWSTVEAGTDALPLQQQRPRGTQTAFTTSSEMGTETMREVALDRGIQASSTTHAISTQVWIEAKGSGSQATVHMVRAATQTIQENAVVDQYTRTSQATQTTYATTHDAETSVENPQMACAAQTTNRAYVVASVQTATETVDIFAQATPNMTAAEVQTRPEETGAAVQASPSTSSFAVQTAAKVAEVGLMTTETGENIHQSAVYKLVKRTNAGWANRLERFYDTGYVHKSFAVWRHETSRITSLERRLIWKMSYFSKQITRPAFQKWCNEMMITFLVRQRVETADRKHASDLISHMIAVWCHASKAKKLRDHKGDSVCTRIYSNLLSVALIQWSHLTWWGSSLDRATSRRQRRRLSTDFRLWVFKVRKIRRTASRFSYRKLMKRRVLQEKLLHLWKFQTWKVRCAHRRRIACEKLHRQCQLSSHFGKWRHYTARTVRTMLEEGQAKPPVLVHVCSPKALILAHAVYLWALAVRFKMQKANKSSKALRKLVAAGKAKTFKGWRTVMSHSHRAHRESDNLACKLQIRCKYKTFQRFVENRLRKQTLHDILIGQRLCSVGSALDRWLFALHKALLDEEEKSHDIQNSIEVTEAFHPIVQVKQVRNPAPDENDIEEEAHSRFQTQDMPIPSVNDRTDQTTSLSPLAAQSDDISRRPSRPDLGRNVKQTRSELQSLSASSDEEPPTGSDNSYFVGQASMLLSRESSSSEDESILSPQIRSWGKEWKVHGLNGMHASNQTPPVRVRVTFSPDVGAATPHSTGHSPVLRHTPASQASPVGKSAAHSPAELRSRPIPPVRSRIKTDTMYASAGTNDRNPPQDNNLEVVGHTSPHGTPKTPDLKKLREKLRSYD